MITNDTLYRIALDICRKEGKGNAITPSEMGYYLDWSQRKYYEQEFAKYATTRRIEDTLLPFVVKTTISSGSLVLPTDYKHALSPSIVTYSGVTNTYPIDIITLGEYEERVNNNLTEPSLSNPVMYFYRDSGDLIDSQYKVGFYGGSGTLSSISFTYLKIPPACVFDYYIDSEGEVQYLEEDGEIVLSEYGDEEYRDGSTSGTFASISKELWWNDNDKLKILELVLFKLGVKMENNAVMQYAGMTQQTNAMQP